MITPLMHLFSCLDADYKISGPVDILYMNKQDRELVISEAKRLGTILMDEDQVYSMTSDTGMKMVSTVQSIGGAATEISPYTALLLTKLRECLPTYAREVDTVTVEVAQDDLSTDAVVLRMEGNPKYVYYYVYSIMEMPSLSYEVKIGRLRELLITLKSHMVVPSANAFADGMASDPRKQAMLSRMEAQSRLGYWQGMLFKDYITYYGVAPEPFTESVLERVKKELWDLGFYGFVNPLEMYMNFSGSRMLSKIDIDVEDWVIDFLTKIVLSGGATVE